MSQISLINKKILGYTVSEKIGSGAFGTIYKAVKINPSGRYVRALKHISIPSERQYYSVLNSMGGNVSKANSYFTQMLNNIVSEIQILNELSEKGEQYVVRYYENDIFMTDSPRKYDIFILMEYLTPLVKYMNNRKILVKDVMKMGIDVLRGIKSCHENGVIHRDIKEENIFVSNEGVYKIGNFGISKVMKDSSKAESLKGTPDYLAPEVYIGKEGYTKSVDLYSLGIVLYRMLNHGRNPFLPRFPQQYFSQDEDKAFEERMSGKTPAIPDLGGEKIGQVLIKALSKSSERFDTANEFIMALEKAIDSTPPEIMNKQIFAKDLLYTKTIGKSNEKRNHSTIHDDIEYIPEKIDIKQNNDMLFSNSIFENYYKNNQKNSKRKNINSEKQKSITPIEKKESLFVKKHESIISKFINKVIVNNSSNKCNVKDVPSEEIKNIIKNNHQEIVDSVETDNCGKKENNKIKDGYGIYNYSNGYRYEGEWKDGDRDGQGKLYYANGECCYEGEWRQGEKNGYGIYYYANKDCFKGEWKDGKINGRGTYYYANGNCYEGEWKNGIINGVGRYYYANGNRYEGEWKNGKADGQGIYYFRQGNYYKGEFKHGKKNGQGIYYFVNGEYYEGNWKNDTVEGYGKYYYANGDFYEGQWKQGKKDGIGVFYYVDEGERYIGQWKQGKKDGVGKYFYANGDCFDGNFKQDLLDGDGVYTFANGESYIGKWEKGKKVF